jgi:hypothetical protein
MVELFLIEDMNSKDLVCQHCKAVAFRIIGTDRESLKFSLGDLIVALNHKCFDELDAVKMPKHINWRNVLTKITKVECWFGIGLCIGAMVVFIIERDYQFGYALSFPFAMLIWILLLLYSKKKSVGKE